MIQNRQHKYIFVSVPKCGTHSMYVVLKRLGGKRVGGFHDARPDLIPQGYYIFTVCRSPFTRAVSLWHNSCVKHDRYRFRRFLKDYENFEDFVDLLLRAKRKEVPRHILLATQKQWHGHLSFNKIIRLENLQKELRKLPFIPGDLILPRVNTGEYGGHEKYYTPEIQEKVVKWAEDDFKAFNYPKEL